MASIVWFHPRSLFPNRGGGEVRTAGLVSAVLAAGHTVTVVQPAGLSSWPTHVGGLELQARTGLGRVVTKVLSRHPLRSARVTRATLDEARMALLRQPPQVCVVGEALSWPFARRLLPDGVPWLYDAHNVEADLYRSLRDTARGLERLTFEIDARRIRKDEAELVSAADAVTSVSVEDAARLELLSGRSDIVVAPSSVPTPAGPVDVGSSPPVVLFVGSLDYPPNARAVRELIGDIMPRVRNKLPQAILRVAGKRPSPEIRRLCGSHGVELHADVDEIASVYQGTRAVALPIRTGSGSRLKVYEALSFGLPVVATSTALQGSGVSTDIALAAESPSEIASALTLLLGDHELARSRGAASRDLFVRGLSWPVVSPPFVDVVDDLAGKVE